MKSSEQNPMEPDTHKKPLGGEGESHVVFGASNMAGLDEIYGDDLAKAMSSNIQAKVVIRAEGEGK